MRAAPATRRHPSRQQTRYHFVGGKGGVGKTTCAAALAIAAAAGGARTLVLSTDPAPSLGDALGVRIGRRPRRVTTRRGVLHAVEIDAATVIREWLASRSAMLRDIALRGTWLDAEDVSELLGLSLPGIDELAGLIELMRIGRSGRYDVIVVDTAPTGHTLRMLAMPETLGRVAAVFDVMQDKHRAIVAALRGRWTPDAADAFVLSLSDDAVELSAADPRSGSDARHLGRTGRARRHRRNPRRAAGAGSGSGAGGGDHPESPHAGRQARLPVLCRPPAAAAGRDRHADRTAAGCRGRCRSGYRSGGSHGGADRHRRAERAVAGDRGRGVPRGRQAPSGHVEDGRHRDDERPGRRPPH